MTRSEREIALHRTLAPHYAKRERDSVSALVNRYWLARLRSCLERFGPATRPLAVADLGAGTCLMYEALREISGLTYTGIDSSREMLEAANKKYGQEHNFKTQAHNLDGAYDVVQAFDVYIIKSLIHHLERQDEFVDTFLRSLARGAVVIISEPNRNFFTHAARELLKKLKPGHFDHDHHDIAPRVLVNKLSRPGVTVLAVEYFGYLSYPFGFPDVLKFPMLKNLVPALIRFDSWWCKIPLLKRFSWHTIYVLRKD